MFKAPPSAGLLDHFSALSDPRQGWRVVYPPPEILLLMLCATLCGTEDFVEIWMWGEQRLDLLRRFMPYKHGLPRHDTVNDVIDALDPVLFQACFSTWVEALRERAPDNIAVDGKTSRRTHARAKGRQPLRMVSAWAARRRLVLAQEAVDEKSNEIVAIPLLVERLQLTAALVTIDAIGTQTDIAERIVAGCGHYLLAFKANRPVPHQDVVDFCDGPPAGMSEPVHTTTDGDHGRIEERRGVVCHKVDWLFSDCRYADEPRLPHLAMFDMVESRVDLNGLVAREPQYYLSSAKQRQDLRRRRAGSPGASRTGTIRCRQRATEHGCHQTHGRQPDPQPKGQTWPQNSPKTRQPELRLPRVPHSPNLAVDLKRFPWAVERFCRG